MNCSIYIHICQSDSLITTLPDFEEHEEALRASENFNQLPAP